MKKEKASRPIPSKIKTKVWAEIPNPENHNDDNEITLCHGYDFYNDLLGRISWPDLLFLLMRGELPSKKESNILSLLIFPGLIF